MTDSFVSEDGKLVDYKRMSRSQKFEEYAQLSSELHSLTMDDVNKLEDTEKFAFFTNIYNALIIHSKCILGSESAETPEARSDFFRGATGAFYSIASECFSPDDIEHGILRANYPHPSQLADVSEHDDLM